MILILAGGLGAARFGPTTEVKRVYYYSPVWSPDQKSVAYFKRTMDYTYETAYWHLSNVTPDRTYSFKADSVELVVRDIAASKENVIKKFDNSTGKVDPTDLGSFDAKIGWYTKGYLQYCLVSMGFAKEIDSGNHFIRPDGKGDTWDSPSYDARSKIIDSFPSFMKNKELYPVTMSSDVFMLDHDAKTVKRLFGDGRETVPKYRPHQATQDQ